MDGQIKAVRTMIRQRSLTDDQVREIVRLYVDEELPVAKIEKRMNISRGIVSPILRGLIYRDVTGGKDVSRADSRAGRHLTDDQAREVVRMYVDEQLAIAEIERRLGAAGGIVRSILTGRTYRHVTNGRNVLGEELDQTQSAFRQAVVEAGIAIGASHTAIAHTLGVSTSAVHLRARRIRRESADSPNILGAAIAAGIRVGLSIEEIARELRVSTEDIQQYLAQA